MKTNTNKSKTNKNNRIQLKSNQNQSNWINMDFLNSSSNPKVQFLQLQNNLLKSPKQEEFMT